MLPWMAEASNAELIAEEARHALGAHQRHFEALDSKARVILGFSAAVTALAPIAIHPLVEAGRAVTVAGGAAALMAFWPLRFATLDVRLLRDEYLSAEPEFMQRRLLETRIALVGAMAVTLRRKAIAVRASTVLLAGATVLTAVGLGMH
jgi:hypothetical protein